ncbi:MAG TPA: hypothetical protein G4O13_07475 [Dehalococcoidia bacterium]|nr:hypothetical protein [Dehalococcoidia bacterium]
MAKLRIVLLSVLLVALAFGAAGCKGGTQLAPAEPIHSAGRVALEIDLNSVQAGVDAYLAQSGKFPTESGRLPSSGKYALIDFEASFTQGAKTYTFYPDIISKLPQHHDEGVWRISSAGKVSVDMDPDDY